MIWQVVRFVTAALELRSISVEEGHHMFLAAWKGRVGRGC